MSFPKDFIVDVELVARVCHEANRILQIQSGEIPVSQPFDSAPDWQKESAMEGVHNALNGQTPQELHASWSEHKRAQGWVYGPVKDDLKKTHPCLVGYSLLPKDQKIKDFMFSAIVEAFKVGTKQ